MSLTVSLTEARELDAILESVLAKLKEIAAVTQSPDIPSSAQKIKDTSVSVYELWLVTRRLIAALRRMGLPDVWDSILGEMQTMLMMAHSLQIAFLALSATEPTTLQIVKGALALVSFATMYTSNVGQLSKGQRR